LTRCRRSFDGGAKVPAPPFFLDGDFDAAEWFGKEMRSVSRLVGRPAVLKIESA
jgi:hypothetical protein